MDDVSLAGVYFQAGDSDSDTDDEDEQENPLAVTNFSIQPLKTSRLTMASKLIRKRIFKGNFIKKCICANCVETFPIPQAWLASYQRNE